MREILFRGNRIDNGEWVEGFLFELSCDGQSVPCIGIEPLSANDYGEIYKSDYCEVYSDTVCQFTGLCDKNGKKIFEGDILLNTMFGDNWIVKFIDGCFMIELYNDGMAEYLGNVGGFEVIGTIYDKED